MFRVGCNCPGGGDGTTCGGSEGKEDEQEVSEDHQGHEQLFEAIVSCGPDGQATVARRVLTGKEGVHLERKGGFIVFAGFFESDGEPWGASHYRSNTVVLP